MYDLYTAEINRPTLLNADISSFHSTKRYPEKRYQYIGNGGALRRFIIIQGYRNWHQLKVRMQLPVGLPLYLCDYLLSFPRYSDFLIKNQRFSPFTHPSLVWSPHHGCFLWSTMWKMASKVSELLDGETSWLWRGGHTPLVLLQRCTRPAGLSLAVGPPSCHGLLCVVNSSQL